MLFVRLLSMILLLFIIGYSAITVERDIVIGTEKDNVNIGTERQSTENHIQGIKPTILNLEHVYTIEGVDFSTSRLRVALYDNDTELTWFTPYPFQRTVDDLNQIIMRDYNVKVSESIELPLDHFFTISMGRKLSLIYYFEESRYDTWSGEVFPRPVFEREFHPNTIFIYLTTPMPRYGFMTNLFTDDMLQFNRYGNIPFEIMPYVERQTGGLPPEERPFQRANPDRR